MINLRKLAGLPASLRLRKAALTLRAMEEALRAGAATDDGRALLEHLSLDPAVPRDIQADLARLSGVFDSDPRRALNGARHHILGLAGRAAADWDLLDSGVLDRSVRRVALGFRVYLEDVRSPFNVGSVFRSAEAFGVEEILLSPFCADPGHPRAERSAMGTTRTVPWRRAEPEDLDGLGPLVALELGGEPVDTFQFPGRGVLAVGSEELGLSPELLSLCAARVSIPMGGAKASLNLGVAFGITARAWYRAAL
ncbi:MAG TPA: TrmH family RNA methyltransferase [Magnetospirillaceae bacterium]|nr:TrmH family RNA methyltransferase [Magnetospirillaceae bacterium]